MRLQFQPRPGTLWMCDFNTGFKPPEMVKKRPVVIIAPDGKSATGLCTVVPLSTVRPNQVRPFHHLMDPKSLPARLAGKESWAKCDMLYTVSLDRLSRVTKRGGVEPATFRVLGEDLEAIRDGVLVALGLDRPPPAGA